ncbi:universal stress protein [candidate division KSB1 bacterium]|nr:universal stress protein [candidate division KSB1 bacterium]
MKKGEQEHHPGLIKPKFRKAVVAVTFSPRTTAVLNESHRLLSLLGAAPYILHVGEDTPATGEKMKACISESNFRDQSPPYSISKGQIAPQVLAMAKKIKADLIIAGALVKEGLIKSSISKVARQLAVKAPCSVLLLTNPANEPSTVSKVYCVVEYNRPAKMAVETAFTIAHLSGARDLLFTHAFRFPKEFEGKNQLNANASKIRRLYHQQDVRLHRYLSRFSADESHYRAQCIHETSRTTTLNFAREFGADLFILPGPTQTEGLWSHIFTSDFELLLQNLPCSIFLTRKANHR